MKIMPVLLITFLQISAGAWLLLQAGKALRKVWQEYRARTRQ